MKLAFTGHRPESLPFEFGSDAYYQLEVNLWQEICKRVDAGCDIFYCGAARIVQLCDRYQPNCYHMRKRPLF